MLPPSESGFSLFGGHITLGFYPSKYDSVEEDRHATSKAVITENGTKRI